MKTHARLQDALVPRLAVIKQAEQVPPDGTFDDLSISRTLKHTDVDGKRWYFYTPPTVAEHAAYFKHILYDAEGRMSINMEGMVDGLVARLKTRDGKPLLTDRSILMRASNEMLLELWHAVSDGSKNFGDLIDAAKKK